MPTRVAYPRGAMRRRLQSNARAGSWSNRHAEGEPEAAAARVLRDLDVPRHRLDPEVAHLRVHPGVVAPRDDEQIATAYAHAAVASARPRDGARGQGVAERQLAQLEIRSALEPGPGVLSEQREALVAHRGAIGRRSPEVP